MNPAQRMGLFGGAFDPPHSAHVALAQAAVAQLRLDRLYVVPTGHAWHKTRELTPAAHRLAMAHLAFGRIGEVVVDDRELHRAGPSYTLDTLRQLQSENPGALWFLLVGQDHARTFDRWHGWPEILQRASLVVAQRSLSGCDGAEALQAQAMPSAQAGPAPAVPAQQLKFVAMDISATQIRNKIASGLATPSDLDPAVASYIAQHHLYQSA